MSGNGRGNMRPTSRSPPFLVVGLLVAMCILAFNYWNVSNKNGELLKQLDALQVDFRAVSDKHLTVEKRAADLAASLSNQGTKQKQLESSLAEKDNALKVANGQLESMSAQKKQAEEAAQSAKSDKEKVEQEKNSANEELNKVRQELEKEKNAPANCDKNACKDVIREVVGALTSSLGKPVVAGALKAKNVDVMQVAQDLLEGGGALQGQQQQGGNPQNPAAAQVGNEQLPPQAQAQVVGQDLNVVQMQQAAPGEQAFPQPGGGGGGNGVNSLQAAADQQFQPNVLKNLPQEVNVLNNLQDNGDSHLPGPQFNQPDAAAVPNADMNAPQQEIVVQKIPQPGLDEANPAVHPADIHSLHDPEIVDAQEDGADDQEQNLEDDELDKEAAKLNAEDSNMPSLYEGLAILSKNGKVEAIDNGDQFLGGDREQLEDEEEEGEADPGDKLENKKPDEDGMFGYDQGKPRRIELQAKGRELSNLEEPRAEQAVARMNMGESPVENGTIKSTEDITVDDGQQDTDRTLHSGKTAPPEEDPYSPLEEDTSPPEEDGALTVTETAKKTNSMENIDQKRITGEKTMSSTTADLTDMADLRGETITSAKERNQKIQEGRSVKGLVEKFGNKAVGKARDRDSFGNSWSTAAEENAV